jgi:hypothetical protein
MDFASGPTTFAGLKATLVLRAGKIVQVDHELVAEESLPSAEIADISTMQLGILWDAIIYVSGYPARRADRRVERLGSVGPNSPVSTSLQTQTGQSAIVRPVRLPTETRLLTSSGRLHAWFQLANDARPPASHIDAIRNYYMIWEDMHGRGSAPRTPGEELKFTRDFVSHGDPLKNTDLLAFIQREVAPGTLRYDPSDLVHQQFVEKRRQWARQLVETEINNLL